MPLRIRVPQLGNGGAGTVYNDSVAETAAATDAFTGLQVSTKAVAETAAATDAFTGLETISGAIAETAAATDAFAATQALAGAVAETAAATDAFASTQTAVGAVSETAATSDTSTGLLTIGAAVAETAAVADTTDGATTGQLQNESIATSDVFTATLVAVGDVQESASASDGPDATGGSGVVTDTHDGGPPDKKTLKRLKKRLKDEEDARQRRIDEAKADADELRALLTGKPEPKAEIAEPIRPRLEVSTSTRALLAKSLAPAPLPKREIPVRDEKAEAERIAREADRIIAEALEAAEAAERDDEEALLMALLHLED